MGRTCSKNRKARLLMGMPEGKRPLERPRRMWVNIIKNELGDGVLWTGFICLRIETNGALL
jgi:hypothetical protein